MTIPSYMIFYIAAGILFLIGLVMYKLFDKEFNGLSATPGLYLIGFGFLAIFMLSVGFIIQQQDGKTVIIQVTEIDHDNSSIELNDKYLVDKDTKVEVGDKLTLQYDANTNHWNLVDK